MSTVPYDILINHTKSQFDRAPLSSSFSSVHFAGGDVFQKGAVLEEP